MHVRRFSVFPVYHLIICQKAEIFQTENRGTGTTSKLHPFIHFRESGSFKLIQNTYVVANTLQEYYGNLCISLSNQLKTTNWHIRPSNNDIVLE